MQIVILLAVGLAAGTLSGALGIGGGLLMVPAMVYLLKMSQHSAQGTTLAVMLPPITALSVYAYYKAGHIDWKITTLVCAGFFFGNYFGGKLAVALPDLILRRIFAVFLVIAAVNMFFKKG